MTRVVNFDAIRELAPTRGDWTRLERVGRLRLTWNELCDLRGDRAVLATPLRRVAFGRHHVVGVLEIVSLVPGKAEELDRLAKSEEFTSIVRTCEALLAEGRAIERLDPDREIKFETH